MMKFTERLKNAWNILTRPTADLNSDELLEWLGITPNASKKAMAEATYYTCIKMMSETMGKIPLKYYQETEKGKIRAEPDDMTYLLTVRPNEIMTPTTLWSTVEFNCQHYGNGYVWMRGAFIPKK